MTDGDNIMRLRPMGPSRKDRTAAERSKRFRERQKERKQAVMHDATPLRAAAPTVTKRAVTAPVRTATALVRAESENTHDFKASDTVCNGSVTASVEPSVRLSVTMTTVQLCALGARPRDGHASRDDLFLADQIIAAFAGQYPRDGIVQIIEGEISDDIDDNEISA